MIEVNNVSKIYTTQGVSAHALKDISFNVPAGEILGIVGHSGAGKSTLIRCLNLLERPSSGQIIIDKQELTTLNASQLRLARHHIGMIFQHFNLLSSRSAYANIAFPLQLLGHDRRTIAKKIAPLIELTGLTQLQHAYPSQLSGGQKQRVAIARALACQPKVLLCDEATSALDPYNTTNILELLKDINRQLGLTIVLITHEMDVIKQVCDRVGILDKGELVEINNTLQFLAKPQTTIGKQFASSCLQLPLPSILQKRLQNQQTATNKALIHIAFHGKQTNTPIISRLSQQLKCEINIIQANIEYIQDQPIGMMLVEVDYNATEFLTALNNITNVVAEVKGYV